MRTTIRVSSCARCLLSSICFERDSDTWFKGATPNHMERECPRLIDREFAMKELIDRGARLVLTYHEPLPKAWQLRFNDLFYVKFESPVLFARYGPHELK